MKSGKKIKVTKEQLGKGSGILIAIGTIVKAGIEIANAFGKSKK